MLRIKRIVLLLILAVCTEYSHGPICAKAKRKLYYGCELLWPVWPHCLPFIPTIRCCVVKMNNYLASLFFIRANYWFSWRIRNIARVPRNTVCRGTRNRTVAYHGIVFKYYDFINIFLFLNKNSRIILWKLFANLFIVIKITWRKRNGG